jgi:hypothetical protein
LTTSNYNRSSLPDNMAKKKKQPLTSDGIYTFDDWGSEGLLNVGTLTDSVSVSYDMGQLNFDYDDELRDKYPALKDAWEHYKAVKQMCQAKEKEDENR